MIQDATLWLRGHQILDLTTEPWGVSERETSMTANEKDKTLTFTTRFIGLVTVFELMSLTMFKKS